MKLNDVKHNHSLTDLLKVLLFSIIMLLPFIDVAVRCGYVMLNKNAYQSYSDTSAMTTTLVSDNSQIIYGNNYMINLLESGSSYSENIFFNSSTIDYDYLASSELSYDIIGIRFYPNNTHIRFIEPNSSVHTYELNDEKRTYLNGQTFNLSSGNLVSLNQPVRFYMVTYTTGKLDNVFEYSVSKLEDSNLYNWTTQTAIYSGVSQMTTQLGITTNIIPIIVCYWFFITIIYIILDIVIRLFTMLTHAIGSKTAN